MIVTNYTGFESLEDAALSVAAAFPEIKGQAIQANLTPGTDITSELYKPPHRDEYIITVVLPIENFPNSDLHSIVQGLMARQLGQIALGERAYRVLVASRVLNELDGGSLPSRVICDFIWERYASKASQLAVDRGYGKQMVYALEKMHSDANAAGITMEHRGDPAMTRNLMAQNGYSLCLPH